MENPSISVTQTNPSVRLKSDLILLLVAVVWGSGFVAQRIAGEHLGFLVFNGVRFLLGALILLPIVRFRPSFSRAQLPWVAAAGLCMAGGSAFQQAGLQHTSIGNTGFITGLYVLFIPLILWLAWRERVRRIIWAAAALAVIGISLLGSGNLPGITGPLRLNGGDGLVLIGSLFWAVHVIVVGMAARRMNPYQFALGQFFVTGLISMALGLVLQRGSLPGLTAAWAAVLYSAVIVIGVGFTLQGVGQKNAPPADAAILLSLETVFAAFFGAVILGEGLNGYQILGAALILAAILIAQLVHSPSIPEVPL